MMAPVVRKASAQAADSLQPQPLVMGYSAMLQEYRNMRRIPDTTSISPADSAQDGVLRLEIDGMVVDETQTKVGRDFYDVFFENWESPEGAFNYTVVVQELPTPGIGTRVLVRVNDEVAFQAQLQPRYEVVEATARQAVYYAYRLLLAGGGSAIQY
jgi:hypothetical protein